jgi:hypothetical protein
MFSMDNSKFLVSGNNNDRDFYLCSTARGSNNLCGKNATKYVKKYKKLDTPNYPILEIMEAMENLRERKKMGGDEGIHLVVSQNKTP